MNINIKKKAFGSLLIKRSNIKNPFMLVHILDLLFFHMNIIVILIIGINKVLINGPNQPHMKINLNITFSQSLQRLFTQMHICRVHYCDVLQQIDVFTFELTHVGFLDQLGKTML